jgi:hypothetical protein
LETLIDRRQRLCHGIMRKSLVEYFVHDNLPIPQVYLPFLWSFVSCDNPGIACDLPNSHRLKRAIIQRTIAPRNSIGAVTSGSRFVSQTADGVRKAARAWL